MDMKMGQTVYTVNNKTGSINPWTYTGILPTANELLVHLVNGKKECYIPGRCVFLSEKEARRKTGLGR